MDLHHLRRRTRLLALLALIALLGAFPTAPSRAQTGGAAAAERLRAAISGLSQIEPIGAAAPARSASPQPVYAVEGPRSRPARSDVPSALAASLADQRDGKGVQRLTLSATAGEPGGAVTLTGRGYTPGQRVDLLWDGAVVTQRQLIVADANGRFEWRWRVPSPAVNGAHTVAALEARLAGGPAPASAARSSGSEAAFTIVSGLPEGSAAPSLAPPAVQLPEVAAPAAAQPALSPKAWTFAVYIAGDNNLSTFADLNIQQMIRSGGTNANVNIVVLTDQENKATRYDVVTAGGLQNVTPASVSGNINTGDPQKFVDFMGFVAQNYPALRYATVIWNHGGGWTAIESDDPTGDMWDMAELRQALQGGLQQLGKPQFDVLLFDACLMAQYEVAVEVANYVDVLVASEQTVPGAGTPYDQYLAPSLVANPATTPEEFGNKIVEAYAASYAADSNARDYTLSSLKLEAPFAAVQSAVDAFASALLAAGSTAAGDIQQARDASQTYAYPTFIDLADFASNVKARVSDPTVQQTANTLLGALAAGGGFLLDEKHGPASTGSHGLTVYLPGPTTQGGYKPTYDQLLVKGTPWHTFVNAFYTGKYPGNTGGGEPVPTPPPPVSSSTSDIAYTQRYSPDQWDLGRITSVPSSDQEAEKFGLLSDGYRNTYPRWSPNGKVVAYVSDRGGGAERTGLEQDLFAVKADGSPLDGATGPVQLTQSTVACPDGPGAGTPCVVEQAYDPSWIGDGSGIIYTKLRVDLSDYPFTQTKQAIRLLALTDQGVSDTEILPGNAFDDDILVSNADYNGTLLAFHYDAPDGVGYDPDFVANTIGFIDFGTTPASLRFIPFNSAEDVEDGNYVITNYPTFRPGTNELAFLYTRVGDPAVLSEVDPRQPPPAGVLENETDTYDIGRMSIARQGEGYQYTMAEPIWAFGSPETGEGVNLRPSWRPDGSGNLTASYSSDGGYTYNVGLFLNVADANGQPKRAFAITSDGYSYLPSWGTVAAADVVARLEVKPAYLEPGATANYYLAGSGFAPGEQVQLARGGAAVGTVTADAKGSFEASFKLPKGSAPGAVKFTAKGATSGKASNEGVLVVLAPRNEGGGGGGTTQYSVYLPLVLK